MERPRNKKISELFSWEEATEATAVYLFINHTAWSQRAMAGIERKNNDNKQRADTRKQTVKLNKENPTEPLSTPICVLSVAYISFEKRYTMPVILLKWYPIPTKVQCAHTTIK